jgi:xylulokinase
MFLSELFTETMVNVTQVPVEMYDTHGAKGAALGSGVGAGIFANIAEAMAGLTLLKVIQPNVAQKEEYATAYGNWFSKLKV